MSSCSFSPAPAVPVRRVLLSAGNMVSVQRTGSIPASLELVKSSGAERELSSLHSRQSFPLVPGAYIGNRAWTKQCGLAARYGKRKAIVQTIAIRSAARNIANAARQVQLLPTSASSSIGACNKGNGQASLGAVGSKCHYHHTLLMSCFCAHSVDHAQLTGKAAPMSGTPKLRTSNQRLPLFPLVARNCRRPSVGIANLPTQLSPAAASPLRVRNLCDARPTGRRVPAWLGRSHIRQCNTWTACLRVGSMQANLFICMKRLRPSNETQRQMHDMHV